MIRKSKKVITRSSESRIPLQSKTKKTGAHKTFVLSQKSEKQSEGFFKSILHLPLLRTKQSSECKNEYDGWPSIIKGRKSNQPEWETSFLDEINVKQLSRTNRGDHKGERKKSTALTGEFYWRAQDMIRKKFRKRIADEIDDIELSGTAPYKSVIVQNLQAFRHTIKSEKLLEAEKIKKFTPVQQIPQIENTLQRSKQKLNYIPPSMMNMITKTAPPTHYFRQTKKQQEQQKKYMKSYAPEKLFSTRKKYLVRQIMKVDFEKTKNKHKIALHSQK